MILEDMFKCVIYPRTFRVWVTFGWYQTTTVSGIYFLDRTISIDRTTCYSQIYFYQSAICMIVHIGSAQINFMHDIIITQHNMHAFHWRHNELDGVSNHQPHDCLLNRLLRRRSKKISKLRVTGLFEGNSPGICEFPAQRASNAENATIWWRHHGLHILSIAHFLELKKATASFV